MADSDELHRYLFDLYLVLRRIENIPRDTLQGLRDRVIMFLLDHQPAPVAVPANAPVSLVISIPRVIQINEVREPENEAQNLGTVGNVDEHQNPGVDLEHQNVGAVGDRNPVGVDLEPPNPRGVQINEVHGPQNEFQDLGAVGDNDEHQNHDIGVDLEPSNPERDIQINEVHEPKNEAQNLGAAGNENEHQYHGGADLEPPNLEAVNQINEVREPQNENQNLGDVDEHQNKLLVGDEAENLGGVDNGMVFNAIGTIDADNVDSYVLNNWEVNFHAVLHGPGEGDQLVPPIAPPATPNFDPNRDDPVEEGVEDNPLVEPLPASQQVPQASLPASPRTELFITNFGTYWDGPVEMEGDPLVEPVLTAQQLVLPAQPTTQA